jgi:hypothetical protein
MVRFLFFADYPGSFTAFTSSVDLPVGRIKKIISDQSQIILLRLTSAEIVVAPRKNLKLKESFHEFNSIMGVFQQHIIIKRKPLPRPISTWMNTIPFFKKATSGALHSIILPAKNLY